MQRMCPGDPSGRGGHCYCRVIDRISGARECCRCGRWNIAGTDWASR
ncbi:conserved hypothetical protein [Nitrosopumilaceae archaeon]|nr:hypothetical protein [Nitrosopumilus sp.]MDA7959714.1 hypothetical protein [Nitrosopumilus sp.]CAI9831025.1 conserved hypothetical protein [Nitrosopumilaceae archaeon]